VYKNQSMSYQVLARKWRPKSFEQLVGQNQTAKALINALESQRLHHAYLFTGTRGVGKTTIARILSKSLNCEKGITSTPCGECSSCVEIDQGNFVDLMEIDAASKTKVEDTRELLDNVQYRPTRGRYKVYLIDEVHMLSGHSFNALLKTLEEPPPHVIFLLATTDPQKLPVTVLSRCLQFHLKRMEEDQIVSHLSMILNSEGIDFEQQALAPIAKGADGSMRDALSLLDQAIAFSPEKLELANILEMLGSIDQSYCYQLLQNVEADDAVALMATIQQMAQYSPDYFEVMSDWLSLLHSIAVAQATGLSNDDQIITLSQAISPADLQLYYQLSLQAKKDLPYAPHPKQGFEMAMLRILAFKPKQQTRSSQPTSVANRANHSEVKKKVAIPTNKRNRSGQAKAVESVRTTENIKSTSQIESIRQDYQSSVTAEKLSPSVEILAHAIETPRKPEAIHKVEESAPPSNVVELRRAIQEQESAKPKLSAQPKQNEPVEIDEALEKKSWYPDAKTVQLEAITYDNWHLVVDQLPIGGNGLQVLLNSLAIYQDNRLKVVYLTKVEHFLTDNLRQSLMVELSHYFKVENFKLDLESSETLQETPKDKQIKIHQAQLEKAYKQLESNPCIAKLQQAMGVTIDKQTVRIK